MLGEINVYEAPLTVHKCAANIINSVHLVPLLQDFDCRLPVMSPTLAETRHTEKDRNSNFLIMLGQKFRAETTDFLLLRKVWNCHCMHGTEVSLTIIQKEVEMKVG